MASQNYTAQPSLTSRVESHIDQLIADHTRLVELSRSQMAELAELKQVKRELEERVRRLERDLSQRDLLLALSEGGERGERDEVEESGEQVAAARVELQDDRSRAYINRLMREVDACIALMNAAWIEGEQGVQK